MNSPESPEVESEVIEHFAFSVGKLIQNYGTIEHLVNEILSIVVPDPRIHANLINSPMSRRLDVLHIFLSRDSDEIFRHSLLVVDGIIVAYRNAFTFRNKVAHNPILIEADRSYSPPKATRIGVNVIRYAAKGQKQEWILQDAIDDMLFETRDLMLHANAILAFYSKPSVGT